MIRKHLIENSPRRDGGFEWRSREPSRLEGLSDAVIGFAVTLLVVSLEVPKTFGELLVTMSGFIGFGISFALLLLIWHAQYTWFRRYAMDDAITVVLTALLLFVVLFFVYPLKFFTNFTLAWISSGHFPTTELADGRIVPMIANNVEFLQMAAIYAGGYGAIFGIFALMYWHAWRNRTVLDLSDVEQLETRYSMMEHLMHAGVGLLAVLLALGLHTPFAMFAFFLIAPLQALQGTLRRKARKALAAA
jgi:uncharacterized membrane protein